MPYTKTALGSQALKDRAAAGLPYRQRAALILFDGRRSVREVLGQTAGLGVSPDDIARLIENGLLQPDDAAPSAPAAGTHASAPRTDTALADFAGSTLSPPTVLPPVDLSVDEQQARYRVAYPLATQLTANLGLRGFRLNLAVEKADGYAGLLHLLPKIEATAGADKAAGLRAALEGVARH